MNKFGKIALKTILWIIGSLIFLFLLIVFLIRIPSVQNFIVGKVTNYLEEKIGTPVDIGYINITFPKKLVLEKVYFEDQSKDTLIAGEKLIVDINMLRLINNTVAVSSIELEGITAKIKRTLPDSTFNFDYIVKAFASEEKKEPEKETKPMKFDLDKVALNRIKFVYNDEVIGTSADIFIHDFQTRITKFDLENNMAFNLPRIELDGLSAVVKQWQVPTAEGAPDAGDFGVTTADTSESSSLPDLGLENLELKNIKFAYENSVSGIDTKFDISEFTADFETLDLNKEIVKLNSLTLGESDSYVVLEKLKSVAKVETPETGEPSTDSTSSMNWVVSAKSLNIEKTNLWFKDENKPRTKGLDYFNMRLTDFNGDLENLYYSADSISGNLKDLTVKDHSGFQLKHLKTNFVYNSTGAILDNLLIETPKTVIRDYVKVSYPSLDAISDHPNLIKIDARISKSHIDMSDIRYLAPDLEKEETMKPLMARVFYIDGRVNGSLDNLSIPKLEFKTLDNTHLIARATIKGLPDMEKLYIDLNLIKFTTGRRDVERLVAKSMLPDSIQLPNSISLNGLFRGGMNGFDTDMRLLTDQGNASVKGKMKMARDTTYDLNVSIQDLNIGKILGQDSVLGVIALNADVNGTGLNPKTMNTNVVGDLQRLDAMGYQYRDISLDLAAGGGNIKGNINSPDPNVQFNLDLDADMSGQYPKVFAELMIDSINFKNLKLMEDDFRYHGKIVADFETLDIDHLNGSLDIINSHVAHNADRFMLDSVSLVSTADTNQNKILFNSEFLTAHMVGKFRLSELGTSIQDVVQAYYNPSNAHDTTSYESQKFEFSATLTHSKFVRQLLPELEEMTNITLDGTFDSDTKEIMAKLIAPKLVYNGTEVENVGLDIITADSVLYYNTLIERAKVSGIELTNTVMSGDVKDNLINFGAWIRDKQNKPQYHLETSLLANVNSYVLSLRENGLMLNYENWNIDTRNRIQFGETGVNVQNFLLSREGQQLKIQSQDSTGNAPIQLSFDNFRIETFAKMIDSESLDISGSINGTADVSRLESSPVFVADLTIDEFAFSEKPVGNIAIKVNNETENTFAADIAITGNGNNIQLVGNFITPPEGDAQIDATLDIKPMTMQTLEALSMGNLENAKGEINGSLKIQGTTELPKIIGELGFQGAQFSASMLNAPMKIDNQKIIFNDRGINFRQFVIKDSKDRSATLNGTIETEAYRDFAFNLNLKMDDFEAMNSTAEDNDLFYGLMTISSDLKIRGNMDNPSLEGSIRVNENTDFYFVVPNENPGVAERDGVVKFVNRSDSTGQNVFAQLDSLTTVSELSGFDIALKLETDPKAKFTVVLDPGTQDELHIQGEAELTASLDASEKITLSGIYTVESGEYTVPLGPLKRKFTFQKGSTITWGGDPLDARLNITAVYSNKFPTLELVQSQISQASQNIYKQRIPFNVLLQLTGALFKPDLKFNIEMDENSSIVPQEVSNNVNIALSNMRNDPAELNKQVFSLIALGRFMSANPFESLSGGSGVEGMARSTVSSFLTNQLNNLASDLITGVEIDFNLQSEQDYLSGSAQNRTDLNVGISKQLFNDRLKVTVGSNFEVEGNTRAGEKSSNIAGDISLEYQLSQDGRYIARVYRKNQYQATLQGQFIETGIGFIINMSYDRFKELFMNSKALKNYYNTESRGFRRRFDVERMEVDSAYRDSVRLIIRDSLMRHSPEYRKRVEERELKKEEQLRQQDSTSSENQNKQDSIRDDNNNEAVRNEDEESEANAK